MKSLWKLIVLIYANGILRFIFQIIFFLFIYILEHRFCWKLDYIICVHVGFSSHIPHTTAVLKLLFHLLSTFYDFFFLKYLSYKYLTIYVCMLNDHSLNWCLNSINVNCLSFDITEQRLQSKPLRRWQVFDQLKLS